MEMEECQNIDLEFEADGLIDDKQFSENSVGFSTHELTGGFNAEKEVDTSLGVNETDHLPQLHESMEPERNRKNGRCNLRKSLAWDSAFFTSAGVLDAEELSTMITGPDKSGKHLLPGIQEEITGSTESLSTLGSDTLTMETLEEDLFVDIRASIQRSSKKPSSLRSSNSKIAAMEIDSASISSLKKEDLAPQNKIPKPGLKKTSSLQTVRMSKCQPKQNVGQLVSGKAIKQDSVHSQTSMAKVGVANSTYPKPPKYISSSIPSSTAAGKRDSVGTGRAKSGTSTLGAATVSGKGTQPPKISSSTGARMTLPKPAPSSNSSLLVSSSTVHSTRSSTSSDSSSNMSSRTNPGKSNLMMPRRNTAKIGNVGTGPIPKTPSRATLKNKIPSSSKIPSSVSPASSISEWSSASSSSSSMVNQKSNNLRTSIDTISCRSFESDTIPLDSRNDEHENQGVVLTSNNPKKSSTQTGGNLHAPAKPSGLRMPSHKFGFFDGVKSSAQSPNRHPPSPSPSHNVLPKNGPAIAIPVRSSNSKGIPVRSSNSKPKTAKTPTARMVPSPSSLKPRSPKPTSPASTKPISPPKPTSPALTKPISPPKPTSTESFEEKKSTDVTKSPSLPIGVKQVVANNTGVTIIEESLGDLKIDTQPVIELSNALLGGDVAVNRNQVKKDCDFICEATEKENGHDRCVGEGLTVDEKGTYQNVNGLINELLSDKPGCAPIGSEYEVCRVPLAIKNSLVNNECIDMPKEVADKTGFLLPASEQKENS